MADVRMPQRVKCRAGVKFSTFAHDGYAVLNMDMGSFPTAEAIADWKPGSGFGVWLSKAELRALRKVVDEALKLPVTR